MTVINIFVSFNSKSLHRSSLNVKHLLIQILILLLLTVEVVCNYFGSDFGIVK